MHGVHADYLRTSLSVTVHTKQPVSSLISLKQKRPGLNGYVCANRPRINLTATDHIYK